MKNKRVNVTLCALLLSGVVLFTSGCGDRMNQKPAIPSSSQTDDFTISAEEIERIEAEYGKNGTKKIFETGEINATTIITDINNIPVIDGYECIKIDKKISSQGDIIYYATYVNVVPVECFARSKDENGEFVYDGFGTPVEEQKTIG